MTNENDHIGYSEEASVPNDFRWAKLVQQHHSNEKTELQNSCARSSEILDKLFDISFDVAEDLFKGNDYELVTDDAINRPFSAINYYTTIFDFAKDSSPANKGYFSTLKTQTSDCMKVVQRFFDKTRLQNDISTDLSEKFHSALAARISEESKSPKSVFFNIDLREGLHAGIHNAIYETYEAATKAEKQFEQTAVNSISPL